MFFDIANNSGSRIWFGLMIAGLIGSAVLTAGCNKKSADEQDENRIHAFVSIQPQAYFVKKIGGDHVSVEVLVKPGSGPHSYEPTAKQMSRLAEAGVFFRIGVPFEDRLMEKISAMMPGLNVVDTRKGIKLHAMQDDEHDRDAHKGHDEHEGMDPHIWMSPRLVKTQANTICDALKKIDPEHAEDYERNLQKFQAELTGLDTTIAKRLAPLKGSTFFIFHPSLGYFADAYGLKQQAVEVEGKAPSARQLGELIAKAKAQGVKVVFVDPQFSSRSAERVANSIGGTVVPIDPLAEDYITNMTNIAEKIGKAGNRQQEKNNEQRTRNFEF